MVFDLRHEYYMLYAVGPVSAGIPSFGNILYLEPIKTSITSPLYIEEPVPRQESERTCICVYSIDFTSHSY